MPLVQISLCEGKSDEYIQSLADGIHEALCHAWELPKHDRFQTITEHKHNHFIIDKMMWDVKRSEDVVVIYITSIPRPQTMKLALYRQLVKILDERINLRKEDIFVSITNNSQEDWSFGCGEAQLLDSNEK